jgi:hypothetical protein
MRARALKVILCRGRGLLWGSLYRSFAVVVETGRPVAGVEFVWLTPRVISERALHWLSLAAGRKRPCSTLMSSIQNTGGHRVHRTAHNRFCSFVNSTARQRAPATQRCDEITHTATRQATFAGLILLYASDRMQMTIRWSEGCLTRHYPVMAADVC